MFGYKLHKSDKELIRSVGSIRIISWTKACLAQGRSEGLIRSHKSVNFTAALDPGEVWTLWKLAALNDISFIANAVLKPTDSYDGRLAQDQSHDGLLINKQIWTRNQYGETECLLYVWIIFRIS